MKREPPDIEKIAIDRIRQLRREKQMTQEKLAERADLTAEAVTRVERGVRMPTLKTLGKIAHGLGVSPAELLDVREAAPRQTHSAHIAKIVSKLEDESAAVQKGAAEIVATYLRAIQKAKE
jgi:transcriptional regulator with XRE-family HTH domain